MSSKTASQKKKEALAEDRAKLGKAKPEDKSK